MEGAVFPGISAGEDSALHLLKNIKNLQAPLRALASQR